MKKLKKEEKKKSTVFLLFCVSVGSFCDELTVVFCSFVCSFSTNSYAFTGGGEGGAGFCFLFPRLPGTEVGRAGKARPPREEGRKERFARWEKEKIRKKRLNNDFLFFLVIFYICWFPKIQIFMVNGSSRNLFKMHCA